jgi:hypothetical protein
MAKEVGSPDIVKFWTKCNHSIAFHEHRLIPNSSRRAERRPLLVSAEQAIDFANTALLKRALSGKASIIITRKVISDQGSHFWQGLAGI